ncbi:MAG TPA: 50S ribosomal protein L22 [Dehalococcoidia bacterium]|nr:50S ribosomal protein L22 [Dehalococcoidia bacterium]
MEVQAVARNVRISPRKVRLLLQPIKGRSVDEAVAILRNAPMPVARRVEKILKSAAANAENNYQLPADELRVKAAYADDGTRLRRYRAGPRGRAKPWTRRFAHITIVVEDRG